MGKWDTLLSESVLKELMLDKLLNRYLMMTLLNQSPASSTVTACSKVTIYSTHTRVSLYACLCAQECVFLPVYFFLLFFFMIYSPGSLICIFPPQFTLSLFQLGLQIAGSLPLSWFTGESVCPPQLHSFTNHLVQTAHSVCTEQPPEEPHTR